ncbi:MAG: MBL fold metallo-hydrolase [Gemmatimonadaceae bacterium]|nr:MBL fold metallo-hydrolase [Gemmatimonadaceae bacterium]
MAGTSRRRLLQTGATCAGHLALASALAPAAARALWARQPMGRVVRTEPFGRLEQVAEGVWALVSTPLGGDRTTLSNGGLIAGRDGVLAVEGFMTPDGARWLAGQARALTGRWPTHVAITHYHADHATGVAGYRADGARPSVHATGETVARVLAALPPTPLPADEARRDALAQVVAPDGGAAVIDLGGRQVRLVHRRGHTASDVSVEVDDPSIVFTGDLVWNGMFPNYVDAIPTALSAAVRGLRRSRTTTYVPGHGAVAADADLARYLEMLGEVERAARAAYVRGTSPADAATAFVLPASLGEWAMFNTVFFERAFAAWARELGAGRG